MIPQANQIYRHFKGNLYRVITVAEHTENSEQLVVYQALYGEYRVFARPLAMFMSEVDKEKYPDITQKMRFELVEQMVHPVVTSEIQLEEAVEPEQKQNSVFREAVDQKQKQNSVQDKAVVERTQKQEANPIKNTIAATSLPENEGGMQGTGTDTAQEENITIDPLLEQYLDTDSYREKINILHGLQHRITEHMLNTMAIVIDFELPEGDLQKKYDALNDCLLTKERYECNRIF